MVQQTLSSRIPLTSKPGCVSVFFVSELIPSSFTPLQRFQVLDVLHYEAPYIPTCIVGAFSQVPQLYFGNLHCNRHLLRDHISDSSAEMSHLLQPPVLTRSNAALPVEVLAHIARYLNRLDMQALLLTSKDYNAKLGPIYFQHVVLRFKPNVFSGIEYSSIANSLRCEENGLSSDSSPARSNSSPASGDSSGEFRNLPPELNMFKNWGSHITKFGFSLEIDHGELFCLSISCQNTHRSV